MRQRKKEVMEEKAKQENPKIRPIEAFPAQIAGKEMIGIKDPTGICSEIVFVSTEAFFLINHMDGTNGLRDLQAAYMRQYGSLLFMDKIEDLIDQLNSRYLLENHHFQDHRRQLREDFKKAATRQAAFAGKGYEADPEAFAYLAAHYTPTGLIEDPVMAIHTTYDPGVPPRWPNTYSMTAALAGNDDRFVQKWVEAEGHCNINPALVAKAFDELQAWVTEGTRPEPGLLR